MSSPGALSRYPRPNVAVDIAVLTVAPATDISSGVSGPTAGAGQLSVLVLHQDEEPYGVLPGRFIRPRQTVQETIADILELELGLDSPDIAPTLLRVFDDPHRDERGWTLSLAHAVTLPAERLSGSAADLVSVGPTGDLATGERLGYDHNQIVSAAVTVMRDRYELAPDPDGLLAGPFTLSELRHVHEAVLGERLRKDTFNRRMREQLEEVFESPGAPSLRRSVGRPAQLFDRRGFDEQALRRRSSLPRTTWR